MANNIIKRIWNQNTLVNIEVLKGAAFQDEDGGHTFEISGVDNSGNAISLSGTVAGVFLRPDNTDVPITGSASGGIVSVTLPAECYDVPGRFGLTVFVTADSQKTCVYAAIGTIGRTSSGSVAPGTSADVVDLINQISAAVATIPASWSGLMADIAPTYSTSAAYPVGTYVYYNGDLYRCTTAITSGETWTAAHWTTAVLGNDVSDLKSAIDSEIETIIKQSLSEQVMPIATIGLVRKSAVSIGSKTIGTDYGSDYYLSNPISVTPGELYKISCSSYGSTAAYAYANASGIQTVFPETASNVLHLVDNEIICIPENITYLYISRYGTASSATIPTAISKYVSNDIPDNEAIKTYLGDFEQNKAVSIEWLDGYAVLAIDTSRPRTDNTHEIASFSVNRGDLIIITYQADHPLNSGRIALSEKITYGSDALKYGFRPIIRRGTDTIAYVADKNMDVTVCGEYGHLPSVKCYSSKAYAESSDFASDRYKQFDYNKVTQKLSISKRSRNNYNDTTDPKPLTLLHFSDIHNNFVNASNIKRFLEMYKGSDIDDAICTGDMSASNFHDYKPIYSLEGYKTIMLCIGNHDVYDADGSHGSDSEQYWATNAQKYSQYFAPSVSDWNVTQPTGAAENGLCYYYKDYTSNNYGYRLIVLDAMAFDDAQYNWFVATLADAKTNSKTVVIAEHFAPITGLSDINGFNTPFMSMLTGMEYNYAVSRLSTTAGSAVNAVDAFIADGGEFACWLCGHMHYDQLGTLVSHPNQIFIAIASANKNAVWLDMPRTWGTDSADLFNIISIDPKLKMIKIERIGATVDDWGRMHDHVSINYATKTLIATS